MAKVFGGGSGISCGDGGLSRVLPTSREVVSNPSAQSFSSSPNVYSKTQSGIGEANLQDFYNKSEIHRLLRTKADISSVYNKAEVDLKLADLESEIGSSLVSFITEAETDEKISNSYDSVISYLAQNYYVKSQLYTKTEINTLINAINVGDGFISQQPSLTSDNTVSPGSNEAVPLTLVASTNSNVNTVQRWVDSQSNSIGRVRSSGRVEFYGDMLIGQNVESWRSALDANERRLSGVANPTHALDAVNKTYMESYISSVIDDIEQQKDENYVVDALVY